MRCSLSAPNYQVAAELMADELQLVPLQVLVLKHRKKVKKLVNGLDGITSAKTSSLDRTFYYYLIKG